MIWVKIGSSERRIQDVDPSWIHEQVNRHRQDNEPVCVEICVDHDQVNGRLSTPERKGRRSLGRPPNTQEAEIFKLWNRNSGDIILLSLTRIAPAH